MTERHTQKLTGPEYQDARSRDIGEPDVPSQPYNVILINADTYRYDNLFDRAAVPVTTPNLDAFAERAVSLSHFYAGSFPTIPERTDLISGRYAWPWYPWQPLAEKNRMPQLLNQHGYVTQLICDCPHLFNAGFNQAFNAAYHVRGQEGDMPFLHMNDPIETVMPPEKTRTGHHFQDRNLVDLHRWTNRYWRCEEDTFPPRTAGRAVRWLEENRQHRPFLLWVDFFDPHEPWDPPEYMVKKYDPSYEGTPMMHPNYGKASDYTAGELRNLRAHYCAEAELVDRWVGRILQKIDDLDLWDTTVVIFTTDHGMSLGEHNRTGKSNINKHDDRLWPLYPEIAHIPLLIAAPGLPRGAAVDILAQPADILPTLIELNGLDVAPPDPFQGSSFASALSVGARTPSRDFVVSGSYLRLRDGKLPPTAVTPMVYTHRWAYAPFGPGDAPYGSDEVSPAYHTSELFDLDDDPYGERNVAQEHPDIVEEMHDKLIRWLEEIGAPDEAIEVYT